MVSGVAIHLLFQQNYQERQRHAAEVRQLFAKLSVRVGWAATVAASLEEFDPLISIGNGDFVVGEGQELASQVREILLVERDVDLAIIKALSISDDIAASPLAGELDPVLWFAIAEDESEVVYGANQLRADYGDLHGALAGLSPEDAVADPARAEAVAHEVADIFYDTDLLRDRGRRLIGRGCWLVSAEYDSMLLKAIPELEADYDSHAGWIDRARQYLDDRSVGGRSCFEMLRYLPHQPAS